MKYLWVAFLICLSGAASAATGTSQPVDIPVTITGSSQMSAVLGVWLTTNPPTIPTVLSSAPQYNQMVGPGAYNGNSSCASTSTCGSLTEDTSFYSQAAQIADIATWKASKDSNGNNRVITFLISDCFNGTFAQFLTATDATNAYNSIVSITDTFGYQGIQWDLESPNNGTSGNCWNGTTIDSIDSQLKSHYGSGYIISQTPRGFELHAGMTKRAWMVTMDNSWIEYYFGDASGPFACSNILAMESGTDGNNEGMAQYIGGNDGGVIVPANKIIFGHSPAQGGAAPCTVAQFASADTTVFGNYPGIGGVAAWQAQADQGEGWTFASTFGQILGLH